MNKNTVPLFITLLLLVGVVVYFSPSSAAPPVAQVRRPFLNQQQQFQVKPRPPIRIKPDRRVDVLEKEVAALHDRQNLLGALHNENFHIVRHKLNTEDLIFLQRDWTIHSLPKYLEKDQMGHLKKFVR